MTFSTKLLEKNGFNNISNGHISNPHHACSIKIKYIEDSGKMVETA